MVDEVELLDRAPNVVFCPHPLMPARDRRMIFEPPRAGERLDAYLARVVGRLPEPCVVMIGDRRVPRGARHPVRCPAPAQPLPVAGRPWAGRRPTGSRP